MQTEELFFVFSQYKIYCQPLENTCLTRTLNVRKAQYSHIFLFYFYQASNNTTILVSKNLPYVTKCNDIEWQKNSDKEIEIPHVIAFRLLDNCKKKF